MGLDRPVLWDHNEKSILGLTRGVIGLDRSVLEDQNRKGNLVL